MTDQWKIDRWQTVHSQIAENELDYARTVLRTEPRKALYATYHGLPVAVELFTDAERRDPAFLETMYQSRMQPKSRTNTLTVGIFLDAQSLPKGIMWEICDTAESLFETGEPIVHLAAAASLAANLLTILPSAIPTGEWARWLAVRPELLFTRGDFDMRLASQISSIFGPFTHNPADPRVAPELRREGAVPTVAGWAYSVAYYLLERFRTLDASPPADGFLTHITSAVIPLLERILAAPTPEERPTLREIHDALVPESLFPHLERVISDPGAAPAVVGAACVCLRYYIEEATTDPFKYRTPDTKVRVEKVAAVLEPIKLLAALQRHKEHAGAVMATVMLWYSFTVRHSKEYSLTLCKPEVIDILVSLARLHMEVPFVVSFILSISYNYFENKDLAERGAFAVCMDAWRRHQGLMVVQVGCVALLGKLSNSPVASKFLGQSNAVMELCQIMKAHPSRLGCIEPTMVTAIEVLNGVSDAQQRQDFLATGVFRFYLDAIRKYHAEDPVAAASCCGFLTRLSSQSYTRAHLVEIGAIEVIHQLIRLHCPQITEMFYAVGALINISQYAPARKVIARIGDDFARLIELVVRMPATDDEVHRKGQLAGAILNSIGVDDLKDLPENMQHFVSTYNLTGFAIHIMQTVDPVKQTNDINDALNLLRALCILKVVDAAAAVPAILTLLDDPRTTPLAVENGYRVLGRVATKPAPTKLAGTNDILKSHHVLERVLALLRKEELPAPGIVGMAIYCLGQLSGLTEENMALIVDTGAAEVLVKLIEPFRREVPVLEQIARVLCGFSTTRRMVYFGKSGVISALITLVQYSPSAAAVGDALAALRYLSNRFDYPPNEIDNVDRIRNEYGAERVARVMREYATNEGVQTNGGSLLWNLSSGDDASKVQICSSTGIQAVLDALKAHPNSTAVTRACIGALKNVLTARSAKEFVLNQGAAPVIVSVLRDRPAMGAPVQLLCLMAMRNLAALDAGAVALFQLGGLEETIAAMQRWPDDGEIMEQACAAVCNFCSTKYCRTAVIERGGVDQLCTAMRRFPQSRVVQIQAVRAFWFLQHHSSNPYYVEAVGGRELILAAMQAHKEFADLQHDGKEALRNMRRPMLFPAMFGITIVAGVLVGAGYGTYRAFKWLGSRR